MKIRIKTYHAQQQADLLTPVSIYLRLRDQFDYSALLESNALSAGEHNRSILTFGSIAQIQINKGKKFFNSPQYRNEELFSGTKNDIINFIQNAHNVFEFDSQFEAHPSTAFFGYTSFNASYIFDNIKRSNLSDEILKSEILHYHLFKVILIFQHENNTLEIYINSNENESEKDHKETLRKINDALRSQDPSHEYFELDNDLISSISDDEFKNKCAEAKKHCLLGNVFQVVISRKFSSKFKGDEFHLYRKLRVVNPSPFLFYFDFGFNKIFGSSPEAQIIIEDNKAEIHPIAGTYRRTGNHQTDIISIENLKNDEKENAEHIMLVDLARNDLSKHCRNVAVTSLKEIQIYSHVIHLVSKVSGEIIDGCNAYEVFADTFPAGTLSGAPKNEALHIIQKLEIDARGFYGGAIGFFNLPGKMVHAIIIRSFETKNNVITCQAGAGIVAASDEIKEKDEVNNKLAALKKATAAFSALKNKNYERNFTNR